MNLVGGGRPPPLAHDERDPAGGQLAEEVQRLFGAQFRRHTRRARHDVRVAVRENHDVAGGKIDRGAARHTGGSPPFEHDVVGDNVARPGQDDAGELLGLGHVDAPGVGRVDEEEQRPLQPHGSQHVRKRVGAAGRRGRIGFGQRDKCPGLQVMGARHGVPQNVGGRSRQGGIPKPPSGG